MKASRDVVVFNVIGYIFITVFALLCVIPFWLIITGSFSDNAAVMKYGFSFWPKAISMDAYYTLFEDPSQILNAYRTTVIVTVCGTLLSLSLCSMSGYVLSRKDYKYRNKISFYFFFTTIFGAGLVPYYILCVNYLHFRSYPLLAQILPDLFSFFYVIIMRSFMAGIPDSICESAKIDGANDFTIFIRLILPLSKPVLATIGLFCALRYWNDWYNALLFVNDSNYFSLQYYLYKILNTMNALNEAAANAGVDVGDLPTQTFKLAVTVVATGPIVLVYPFLQKYFIKGMTVGAVKG